MLMCSNVSTTRWGTMLFAIMAIGLSGCGSAAIVDGSQDGPGNGELGKSDASIDAIVVNFEFSGQVLVSSAWSTEKQVEGQLLFTIGQLNGERSVGRLDKVELTDVTTTETDDGTLINYTARMPVAWGKRNNVPEQYTLVLPSDMRSSAERQFFENYGQSCVDVFAYDVDTSSIWYYYRPQRVSCQLDDADVIYVDATVTVSSTNTTGKYPEYHKVWEDNVLEVVAIFGKFKHGATDNGDAGIRSYNQFVRQMQVELATDELVVTPTDVSDTPGVDVPDVTIEGTLPDGKRVRVVALLVDGVQNAGANFDARYEALSGTADLIAYNGHSGLGANIRALARKGSWVKGQYAIVFMNGCDTYAYVDSALADAHAEVNDDDPNGTRFLDVVTNAMPAPATYSSPNTMALTLGLLAYDAPQTYEEIFTQFNRSQVVLVSGEEDNEFEPGIL